MTERHPFDVATDLEPVGEDRWLARTSDPYWNMVGPFGGLVAALLFKSAYSHPAREGEPVALTVNFCAAVAKGEMKISQAGANQPFDPALDHVDGSRGPVRRDRDGHVRKASGYLRASSCRDARCLPASSPYANALAWVRLDRALRPTLR